MSAPTIFVAIVNGTIATDVLRTGLTTRLLDVHPRLHLVILSPLVADPDFVREFEGLE